MIRALVELADRFLIWLTPKTTRLADPTVPTDSERARALFDRLAARTTTDIEEQS